MATIFDNHQGLWDAPIDVPTVFADNFDGSKILPFVAMNSDYAVAYRMCAFDVLASAMLCGSIAYSVVNGNNVFGQACLLLGFGACAYAVCDNSILAALGIHDTDTVHIVDVDGVPTAVEGRHRAPIIHRFRAKKK